MIVGLWRRYLAWRMRNVGVVDVGDAGFSVRLRNQRTVIGWAEIERVAAYKRDALTVDVFCLLVQSGDGIVELHEDMRGFEPFVAALEARLGLAAGWRLPILFPAFATNATIVFRRDVDPVPDVHAPDGDPCH